MRSLRFLESVTVTAGLSHIFYHVWPPDIHTGMMGCNYLLALVFSHLLPWQDHGMYRLADSGVWCGCLFPFLVYSPQQQDEALLQLMVLVTLWFYIWMQETSTTSLFSTVLLLLYTIMGLVYHRYSAWLLSLGLVYTISLWTIPRRFPRSFTLGESALMTQMLVFCLYRVSQNIYLKVGEAPPLDILTSVAAAGIVLVVTSTYLVTFGIGILDSRWLLVTWFLSVLFIALGVCLPSTCILIGPNQLKNLLIKLLTGKKSIILILWWIVCTFTSVGVVCFYGNRKSTKIERQMNGPDVSTLIPTDPLHIPSQELSKSNKRNTAKTNSMLKNLCHQNKKDISFTNEMETKVPQSTLQDMSKIKTDRQFCDRSAFEFSSFKQSECYTKQDLKVDYKSCSLLDTLDINTKTTAKNASSNVRKYFHVIILCVYVPGLFFHRDLLYLASVAAFGVLIILEAIRVFKMPHLASTLTIYLEVFLDDQDMGDLILTPIYLLVGCSLPLWLLTSHTGDPSSLLYYSGLISVGVGDSSAAIVGRRFGRHKWSGSNKSLEGTLASVFSQICAIMVLQTIGVDDACLTWPMMTAVILVALLEATSQQIDNLTIPVFALALFSYIR